MSKQLEEVHPGEILLEEFLAPMAVSVRRLASDLDVPISRISEVVRRTRPITADTAVRLGLFFKMDPRFWMNLQTEYDMRVASRELAGKVANRIRVFEPEATVLSH